MEEKFSVSLPHPPLFSSLFRSWSFRPRIRRRRHLNTFSTTFFSGIMVKLLIFVISALLAPLGVFAHPVHSHNSRGVTHVHSRETPELDILFEGNAQFRSNIEGSDPGLLKKLADDGQGQSQYCSSHNRLSSVFDYIAQPRRLCSSAAQTAESVKERFSMPSRGLSSLSATLQTSSIALMQAGG